MVNLIIKRKPQVAGSGIVFKAYCDDVYFTDIKSGYEKQFDNFKTGVHKFYLTGETGIFLKKVIKSNVMTINIVESQVQYITVSVEKVVNVSDPVIVLR